MWLKKEEKGNDEQTFFFFFFERSPWKVRIKNGDTPIFFTNTHIWKQCMEKYAYSSW